MPQASPADFPYDLARVFAALPGPRNSPLRALGTVAEAMSRLGHETVVRVRDATATLSEVDPAKPGARNILNLNNEKLYALDMDGHCLSLAASEGWGGVDRGWEQALRRLHTDMVAKGHGESGQAREWETCYIGKARVATTHLDHLYVKLATELLLDNAIEDWRPAPPRVDVIDPDVRALLRLDRQEHITCVALSEALNLGGLTARPIQETILRRADDGTLEQRLEVRVEYGEHGDRLLLTDEHFNGSLYYTTPNEHGFVGRTALGGVHVIKYGPENVDPLVVEHSQALVARLVQAALERDVARASDAPRARM